LRGLIEGFNYVLRKGIDIIMNNEIEQEEAYIIPHNYTDTGKVLGLFDKQSFYLSVIWFLLMGFINFKLLPISIDAKIFTLILLVCPPGIIALVGIGGDTLIDFIGYIVSFKKRARTYYYEK